MTRSASKKNARTAYACHYIISAHWSVLVKWGSHPSPCIAVRKRESAWCCWIETDDSRHASKKRSAAIFSCGKPSIAEQANCHSRWGGRAPAGREGAGGRAGGGGAGRGGL